ncbi:MAG: HU family DNA-binding protein [Mycobacteriales bacterium]
MSVGSNTLTVRLEEVHGRRIFKEGNVNKAELAGAIAGRLGVSRKDATAAVDAVFDEITSAVAKGEKVSLTGFGVFDKKERQARMARNPRTGEAVKVEKSSAPAFRAGQAFKDVVARRA